MIYNLVGLLILALDIYAIYLILNGPGDGGKKVLWILLILLLPLIGVILYFLLERRKDGVAARQPGLAGVV